MIIDAHLDLSYNALRGRDVLRPAREQQADDEGIPTVGLPDLQRGNIGLICATIFCAPSVDGKPGYHSADEAHAQMQEHLRWYERQMETGAMRQVTCPAELPKSSGMGVPPMQPDEKHGRGAHATRQAYILLLEGADPIRTPADVEPLFHAGVRIVGLSWKRTRYAGGTGAPGPLTSEGIELVRELDRFGIIHDASHLAEESFWQLLDITQGPVIASHSNCRAIVPTDRQLSDDMIRAIADRGGVIGINFYDKFLLPPEEYGHRRANLTDVVRHVQHICDLVGNTNHVGIGTDMDGGLGREQIPIEIETSADLSKLVETLSASGYKNSDIEKIMAGNWMSMLRRCLP